MINICLTIILICAAIAVVVLTGALIWYLFNIVFCSDEGYWHDHFEKQYEWKSQTLKEQYDREYEKKLKDETTKILMEFYEKDKGKEEKEGKE